MTSRPEIKKFAVFFCLFFVVFSTQSVFAQDIWKGFEKYFPPIRNYVVYQTTDSVIIDGKGEEPAWEQATWTGDFADIEGPEKPAPLWPTRLKMIWDQKALYILAELTEPNIWAYYQTHDQIVYHENDFEVFIDPDQDTQNYFEFELNAANTLFDLFMTKPYRNGGLPIINWDAPHFRSAVSIDGTINDPKDTDRKWTIEMAIPFEDLRLGVFGQVPADGQTWKINFSRVNWQTEVVNGKYQRKKDAKTGRQLSEYNWVWNPTGEINMHLPERWGMIQFSEQPVANQQVVFKTPEGETFRKYLWLVFYKQQQFMKNNKRYAGSLAELELPGIFSSESGENFGLTLWATEKQYTAAVRSGEASDQWMINDQGIVWKTTNNK